MTGQERISATASLAVHPGAARAQAGCLGVGKGRRQNEEVGEGKSEGEGRSARRRIGEPACAAYDQAPTSEYFFIRYTARKARHEATNADRLRASHHTWR